jgi:predicted unusual protein kinase regulating ubiquinone biosynthesis (AarF/ABC1/UbiB family)
MGRGMDADDGMDTARGYGRAVPSGRLARLARLGGLAGGLAGGVLAQGAAELVRGRRPVMADLVLTPANAHRLTAQLSHLRGAAMKLGQMLSLDAGDVLPPELTAILSALRDGAHPMPPRQLRAALDAAWGAGWMARFSRFDVRPIASASIGQVHRARTRDGRDLAIKLQYPGVAASIDSDLDNVAAVLRLSGIVPRDVDFAPLLHEARAQLHQEADYTREAACLERFALCLGDAPDFRLPALHRNLCTPTVLAMDFVESSPIEDAVDAPQQDRDRLARSLIELTLRELFEFRLMQTDPNFANYRFDPRSGKIVLLDFGAVRSFDPDIPRQFGRLLRAGLGQDRQAIRSAMIDIGYFAPGAAMAHQDLLIDMFDLACAPLRQSDPFDFGTTDLVARLRDAGLALGGEREFWHVPPAELLFLHRKIGGMFLLAARLNARVALRPMVGRYGAME